MWDNIFNLLFKPFNLWVTACILIWRLPASDSLGLFSVFLLILYCLLNVPLCADTGVWHLIIEVFFYFKFYHFFSTLVARTFFLFLQSSIFIWYDDITVCRK